MPYQPTKEDWARVTKFGGGNENNYKRTIEKCGKCRRRLWRYKDNKEVICLNENCLNWCKPIRR